MAPGSCQLTAWALSREADSPLRPRNPAPRPPGVGGGGGEIRLPPREGGGREPKLAGLMPGKNCGRAGASPAEPAGWGAPGGAGWGAGDLGLLGRGSERGRRRGRRRGCGDRGCERSRMGGKEECGRGRAGKAEVPRVRGIRVAKRTESRKTAGPGRESGPGWQGDTGRTGGREKKDSGRQEVERTRNPSREGSLEGPVQRARDAARLGVREGKGNAGGKEGPGMQGMWLCRVERGRRGKGPSEGSGIRSRAGDATYWERGRAGVRERKGVQGVRERQGIQQSRDRGRAGVWQEQERRRV